MLPGLRFVFCCMHSACELWGLLPATRFWDGLLPMRENKTPAVIVSLTIWTLFPKSKVCSENTDNSAERRIARMKIFCLKGVPP